MITAQNGERTVTRNASLFKKLPWNIPVHPLQMNQPQLKNMPEHFKDYGTLTLLLLRSMV